MKFLLGLISTLIISFLVQYYSNGPWWSLALVGFAVGALIGLDGFKSFLFGFLALSLLWGIYAFVLNGQNDGILAIKVGELFRGLSPSLLMLITALISGITGGLASMTGSFGRQLFQKG